MTDCAELDQLAEELTLRRKVGEDGIIQYLNERGELHRIYGPAVIYPNGYEFWFQNGRLHRLDGPAVIHINGFRFWFIDGIKYTEEEFNAHPLVIAYARSKQSQ